MSAPTAGHPRTTARAATLAVSLGVLALAAHEQLVGLGAVTGAVLATAIVRTSSGDRFVLPAAMLCLGVFGSLGALGVTATTSLSALPLTVAGVVLGTAAASLLTESTVENPETLERVAFQGMVLSAGLFLVMGLIAGPQADLTALLVTGQSTIIPGILLLVAGSLLGSAVAFAPPAMIPFTTVQSQEQRTTLQKQVARLLVVCSVVGAILLSVVLSLSVVPDWVAESVLLRVGLLAGAVSGLVWLGLGWYTRWSWHGPGTGRDPAALLGLGTIAGFLLVGVGLTVAIGPPVTERWLTLFGFVTPMFGAGWFVLGRYARVDELGSAPEPANVAAAVLCLSGVVVAVTIPTDAPTGTGTTGVAAVGAIAAGLFVHRAGRFGRRVGAEVGAAAVTRRPQLVWLGWLGALTGLGLVLTVASIWVATVFGPTFSVSATAGALAGCVALFAGGWLLLAG